MQLERRLHCRCHQLDVDLVQTSCGFGVPLFTFEGERRSMDRWADAKSEAELAEYRHTHNRQSIDGLPTGLAGSEAAEIS